MKTIFRTKHIILEMGKFKVTYKNGKIRNKTKLKEIKFEKKWIIRLKRMLVIIQIRKSEFD
jgi:hypothetical protein